MSLNIVIIVCYIVFGACTSFCLIYHQIQESVRHDDDFDILYEFLRGFTLGMTVWPALLLIAGIHSAIEIWKAFSIYISETKDDLDLPPKNEKEEDRELPKK